MRDLHTSTVDAAAAYERWHSVEAVDDDRPEPWLCDDVTGAPPSPGMSRETWEAIRAAAVDPRLQGQPPMPMPF